MRIVRKINWPRAIGIFLLLPSLFIVNYFVTPFIVGPTKLEANCRPHFGQKFDSKVWKESGLVENGKDSLSYGRRYEMVDDVLNTRISIGMDEGQVMEILGNPDGLVDKKSIMALGNPYGINNSGPNKEILESHDDIAYWSYHLAYQRQYPAKSLWFPGMFLNFDRWKLIVKMQNRKVATIQVSF